MTTHDDSPSPLHTITTVVWRTMSGGPYYRAICRCGYRSGLSSPERVTAAGLAHVADMLGRPDSPTRTGHGH